MKTYRDYLEVTPDQARILGEVRELLDQNQAERALSMLTSYAGHESPPLRNARGVCLLRLGRHEEAMALFREMYYPNNAFAVPEDAPTEVRVNYISSLLMMGRVLVGASLLYNVPEQGHPGVLHLRAAIRAWKRSLPWWGRVLLPIGFYPESAPNLGHALGWLWLPPVRQTPAPRKKAA